MLPLMPWVSELFSAPALALYGQAQGRERLAAVPYFAGLMAGETEALIRSLASRSCITRSAGA